MIIGIDIDDTITYTAKRANEILHQNDEYKMVKDYHDLPDEIKKEFVDKNLTTIVKSSPKFDSCTLEILLQVA